MNFQIFKNINLLILSLWKIDFAVGGQAVIEGVMMRSPNAITIAVRKPDKSISVKKKRYRTITQRFKFLNIPILRGIISLFEMMVIGARAINYSAGESMDIPEENSKKPSKIVELIMFVFSLIIALALSIFLFKFVPLWITTVLENNFAYIEAHWIVFNLIDGFIKMFIFLAYIWILSVIPSFRRIFEYHGAEHKSIFAYENKLPLTVENAKKQTRFHPRCGTSFIIIVFAISIILYTFVPKQETFLANLILRLAILPLIAGISYEYLKLSAKYAQNCIVKGLIAPGLWFQHVTTKEPDNSQLEVGLESLKAALEMEDSK